MKLIALIPARSGSKRIPGKNFKELAGIPLIEYTIKAALRAKLFDKILISSNDDKVLDIALKKGISGIRRPDEISGDGSPDIDWISHALKQIRYDCDVYFILRPTSPFRTSETIIRAFQEFQGYKKCTSLKSIEPISQWPQKAWHRTSDGYLVSYVQQYGAPYTYEQQNSSFGELYIQNGCIDICKISVLIMHKNTYLGSHIKAFCTKGLEGFDINTPLDWEYAEMLMNKDKQIDKNN